MQTDQPLSGITAAAWRPDYSPPSFFLLEPAKNQFWRLDPAPRPAKRYGPFPLPAGTIKSYAFGASTTQVYVVIGSTIYRVPITGSTSAGAVVGLGDSPVDNAVSGAYAGGWFLVGEATGATHALKDAATALDGGTGSLSQIHGVMTDGTSFGFRAATTAASNT